jgi:two-component system cell cycle sensor histidine kinase/response regulator CckA
VPSPPHQRWTAIAPDTWRADLLRIVLRGAAVLGTVVYVPSVVLAVSHGMLGVVVLDTVAMAAVLVLAAFAGLPPKVRAAGTGLVMYMLGAGLMVSVGSISQIYLFAFSLLTTLLLSGRWGLATVALNAVTMLAIGYLGIASPTMVVPRWQHDFGAWSVITANFVFVNTCLVLALGAVIGALESSLRRANAARDALEREQLELVKLNESLALEVRERLRTEVSLHESKALQRIAGRTARVGGWLVDLSTQRAVWSDEMCELHEVTPGTTPTLDEAIAFYASEWRDPIRSAFDRCVRDGTPFQQEAEIITASGKRLWVRAIGNAPNTADSATTHIHGALQDITPQKLAEAKHEKLEAQLRQAQKMDAVGRLAGGVAHDFNNMLSVILGNAHMTMKSMAPGDERLEDMQQVIDAAQRSAELTNQLLAFARQQPIEPALIDLNESIGKILKMLGRLIGEDVELIWKPGPELSRIKMDRAQIDQILANLAVNARDAIAGVGKLVIETRNASFDQPYCDANTKYSPGDYVQLSVSDSGCGMDEATLGQVFEPFFTTKGLGKGTGLGLATVYGIVKQNRGFITVYSEAGQGSTFQIYLPQSTEVAARPHSGPIQAPVPRGNETLLLVEDEGALLRVAARMLRGLGYTVIATSDPLEAITLAAQNPTIGLLVTDVVMPSMTGRALFEELSRTRPDLKCLFMSGYTADVISHRGVLEQGMHFLQKPFALDGIAHKIREVLGSF